MIAFVIGRVRAQTFVIALPFPYQHVAVKETQAQRCLLYPSLQLSSRFLELQSELPLSQDLEGE